jgi:hypothetical protein
LEIHNPRWLAMQLTLRFLVAAVLTSAIVGCDDRPKRVPVAGQVLIDGQPLTQGYVRLVPPDGHPATGIVESDGRFRLTSFDDGDGCIVGRHTITIIAKEQITPTRMKWLVPKKYQDAATTDREITIDAPTDSLKIELTWDGGQPFIEDSEATGEVTAPIKGATSALQD